MARIWMGSSGVGGLEKKKKKHVDSGMMRGICSFRTNHSIVCRRLLEHCIMLHGPIVVLTIIEM